MFDEDDTKKPVEGMTRNLDALSVAELEDYIVELKAEIIRAENDIKKKKDVFSAADNVFK